MIGFLDDYLKVVLRRSDGLLAWQKMLLQIVVTGIFAFYMIRYTDVSLTMLIPFSHGKYLDLGWVAVPLLFFVVIGTVNGVNFTDGLDFTTCDIAKHIMAEEEDHEQDLQDFINDINRMVKYLGR